MRVPSCDMRRRALCLLVSFPKTQNPSLIMRKTPGKPKLRDLLQNTGPELLRTVKVTKTKIRLRNPHRPEEANMIAQCNVASMGSWSRNRAPTGEQEKPRESPERR